MFRKTKIPKLDIPPFPGIDNLRLRIDTAGIEKLLGTLQCNKAPGPDQLLYTYLQATAEETAPILAAIFTQSLRTGQYNYRLIGLLQMSALFLRKVTSTFPVIIGQFL